MADIQLEGAGPDPSSFATAIATFLMYLNGSGCSPNTARAYRHDLSHLVSFLDEQGWDWRALTPARAVDLLIHLRSKPSRRRGTAQYPSLAAADGERSARLSSATINRVLAAVSSFYEWAQITDRFDGPNPVIRIHDRAAMHVSDRHRPFLTGVTSQSALRSPVRLRQIHRLPRPMADELVDALIAQLRTRRDLAIIRLMLDGGLRPGEVLGLHLADIAYGRRRVTIRVRFDHPRGVRSKSRSERVVDLHESATLEAVSSYVMTERPQDTDSPFLFLVGGSGPRSHEALSYSALAKFFARACDRANIRKPWVTPHALRHTHATKMWEAGMRELTLQRRLGHASPEATRVYTRVSERDLPRIPDRIPRYIPRAELERLMEAIRALSDPFQRAAMILARWSGARRSEIQRLSVDCLDQYADGTARLRLPIGKTSRERQIPLHDEAAEALRVVLRLRAPVADRMLPDERTGDMVRFVFVWRGKLMSTRRLFGAPLKHVCAATGLVDAKSRPTVTMHRFRHTLGTELAERGAKLHTIMSVLGHESPQMTMVYARISDAEVLRDYQSVLEPGAIIAGAGAEAIRSGDLGEGAVDWLRSNFFKTALELGHCLRLPSEGPCECDLYLSCSRFVTTPCYAPRLRERRRLELSLADDARARSWSREVERHCAVARRVEQLLTDLGEELE